jgi:hypothetical protein
MPSAAEKSAWTDEQRAAYRAKQAAAMRKRRKDPEFAEKCRAYARERTKRIMADSEKLEKKRAYERNLRAKRMASEPGFKRAERSKSYKQRYGVDFDQREVMLEEQGGKCRLCSLPIVFGKPSKSGGAHLDHCHETGRVRSVLCGRCNMSLGYFGDDPKRLRAAAEYLEIHRRLAGAE